MSRLFPAIATYCQQLETQFDQISLDRQQQLLELSACLKQPFQENKTPAIIAICTHNSRRSHLAQLWLAIAVDYYQLPQILTFSGGTEVSALNYNVIETLRKVGLQISSKDSTIKNPIYEVSWNNQMTPYLAFSKQYTNPINPQKDFVAIMVCNHADIHCPLVTGSKAKFTLAYQDPKNYDETDLEVAAYLKTSNLIGCEMLFILNHINH